MAPMPISPCGGGCLAGPTEGDADGDTYMVCAGDCEDVDDVSTADSNRRQYARYIQKHSFEKLMNRLKKQLAKLESR